MIPALAKTAKPEELQGLIAFYQTEPGRQLSAINPIVYKSITAEYVVNYFQVSRQIADMCNAMRKEMGN